MARGDNRRSLKMRQRKSWRKQKDRARKRADEGRAAAAKAAGKAG